MPTFANDALTLEMFQSVRAQAPLICMRARRGASTDGGGCASLGMSRGPGSGEVGRHSWKIAHVVMDVLHHGCYRHQAGDPKWQCYEDNFWNISLGHISDFFSSHSFSKITQLRVI